MIKSQNSPNSLNTTDGKDSKNIFTNDFKFSGRIIYEGKNYTFHILNFRRDKFAVFIHFKGKQINYIDFAVNYGKLDNRGARSLVKTFFSLTNRQPNGK